MKHATTVYLLFLGLIGLHNGIYAGECQLKLSAVMPAGKYAEDWKNKHTKVIHAVTPGGYRYTFIQRANIQRAGAMNFTFKTGNTVNDFTTTSQNLTNAVKPNTILFIHPKENSQYLCIVAVQSVTNNRN